MHPAYSVILFTTASGAGYGLLALLGISAAMDLGLPQTAWFGFTALALSLGLITIGLLSSTFHLGHPERAWRAFSQWRSSWLSREGVAAVLTYLPAGLFGLLWVVFGEFGLPWKLTGLLSALGAIATVWCTGMIYGCLTTIRQWHHPLVAPVYLILAAATGSVLFALLMQLFGAFEPWQGWVATLGLAIAAIIKLVYWRSIDAAPRDLTIGDATGLGAIGEVRQLDAPHTQSNFIQREMGYRVARKHAIKLRWISVAGGLGSSLTASSLALATGGGAATALLTLAASAAAVGVILERWLFFAEAEHAVNLFYGRSGA
ncbi:MAG: DmsC/YnfH family molybdoenzyme membrane anchor subunit [Pseudomonadota bacterium]